MASWVVGYFALKSWNEKPSNTQLNLVTHGDHAGAMQQARQLLEALSANNWDSSLVNQQLLRHFDQDFAGEPFQRSPNSPTFFVSRPDSIYWDSVAFYATLYVRRNIGPGNGPEGIVSHPEGFFIVGWKNGTVNKIPISQVRLKRYPGEKSYAYIFPGMERYSELTMKYPGVP